MEPKQDNQYTSIHELSARIKAQKVSPVEIVEACLMRIEELKELNAFITVLPEQAREQAKIAEKEIQEGKWRGPLHGIPVGIKDFYDTAGVKTTAAFKFFKNRVPEKDAVGVAKLKKAGAIIIGKTNMHTLGMGTTGMVSAFGPARNPWDDRYIPGGSSSGSATAVASGMCYATFDTDAMGSCRLPAACCGVIGFKGTYGLIDPTGILAGERDPGEMIRWLAHCAITTRSVKDTALVLNVLAEHKDTTNDFAKDLGKERKLRIGVVQNFKADTETTAAFEKAVKKIKTFGYPMSEVDVPFSDPTKIATIEADRKSVNETLFKEVDILLLPTTTRTIPLIKDVGRNQRGLSPENAAFANYYGIPALSIPCGLDTNGMPIGLQMVTKPWEEMAILHLANQFQEANNNELEHPGYKMHKELSRFERLQQLLRGTFK